MGTDTFFSQLAGKDRLANDLGLPGADKYAQAHAAWQTQGPYTGVGATLAGANAGYQAGGPGAVVGAVNAPGTLRPYAYNANTGQTTVGSTATQQGTPTSWKG